MAEVKILVEGYARTKGKTEFASPTTVLIKDRGLLVIVDPGSNKKMLLASLKKVNLKPRDIDLIFLTHYHLDHVLNIRLFPDKIIYDGNTINDNDLITEYKSVIPGSSIQVIPTPGHADEHCSLAVKTKMGRVIIAGDVFWWSDQEEQKTDSKSLISHRDPFVKDEKELKESRRKLLKIADYVIPGHGKMFKVKK